MRPQPLPKGFLWGNSTSSMQTEGGWNEGGKGLSVYDVRPATAESSDWHVAIDEYHRYAEDFDLMAKQGMNCYRFQISWSRICPSGDGDFNAEGIAFYDHLIDALIARHITPMICLYHFDMPLALAKKYNGFIDRHVVDAFVRFGKKMVDCFADKVPYWITFNEQNLYFSSEAFRISGYLKGPETESELYTISHHVMLAHAQIANYLHATTKSSIGGMLAYSEVYPASPNPRDVLYARQIDEFMNRNLIDAFTSGNYSTEVMNFVKKHHIDMDYQPSDESIMIQLRSDFIAFSYYRSDLIDSTRVPVGTIPNHYLEFGAVHNPYLQQNEWGWNVDPLGFRDVLSKVYDIYHVPMFPIENGIGLREEQGDGPIQDDERIAYHREHIRALEDAVNVDGAEVIGYLGWGLIDIPSSSGNMDKRYGMVYVNSSNKQVLDLKRTPKKSYAWFKRVIATNGADLG